MTIAPALAQDTPAAPAPATAAAPQAAVTPTEMKQAFSYLMGYRVGRDISMETASVTPDDFDHDAFFQAISDGLKGSAPSIDPSKIDAAMGAFIQELQKRDQVRSDANAKAGKEFLEKNAKAEGVTTTDSGLQYKVLKKGDGRKYDPAKDGKGAICSITYEGRLVDGTVFDKSDEPIDMEMNRVVPGFSEALGLMPIGSEWEIYIPSNLAYGERGPAPIGNNATLIFKITLKDIQPGKGTASNPIELTPEIEAQLRAQGLEPLGDGQVVPAQAK